METVGAAISAVPAPADAVKAQARGTEQRVAEQLLRDALRERGMFLDPASLAPLARTLRDPWGPLRHPLRHRQDMRRLMSLPDPEAQAFEQESRRVRAVLEELADVVGVESRRTFDGNEHVVTVDPMSPMVVERVRRSLDGMNVLVVGR